VRSKPSGNIGVKFQCYGHHYWHDTYRTADEAARAYDVVAWRFGRSRHELSFSEIDTRENAEFLGPQNFSLQPIKEKKKNKSTIRIDPNESNNLAMPRFVWEHPEYVQAEQDFYGKREAEQNKKQMSKTMRSAPRR
jgi:hypothetical protein